MTNKILVIGGTGKIGSELLTMLEPIAPSVRVLVRNQEIQSVIKNKGFDVALGDLENPNTLTHVFNGISKLFLLTAPAPNQAGLQKAVIKKAKEEGVKFITRISAMGIDPSSENPLSEAYLAQWHYELEKYLEDTGLSFCHLRPNFFMQNILAFKPSILQEGKFYGALQKGAQISLVHVKDIARVAYHVLTDTEKHMNKMYNITGPEALTFDDIAREISLAIGKSVEYCYVAPEQLKKSLEVQGIPDWFVHDKLCFFKGYNLGYGKRVERTVENLSHLSPTSFRAFVGNFKN